ncbi:MAG: protein kinase, partial [Acidimicrobiia bacterium]
MPPPLPARYRLEVRLGRDQDIEEWLATDEHLDRPVLIRMLGPDATEKRRADFLQAVQGAAAVRHPHLEPIFEAEEVADGAYFVSEWNGGMTLRSRLDSGETMEYPEFAANAAGLAGALSALHKAGLLHAAIEPGAILYTVSRPARLGGFGRARRYLASTAGDVSDLAGVLEQALTGFAPGGPPPSEVVDGVPPALDRALQAAQRGELSADALSHALEAIPRPSPPVEIPTRSWRTLVLAAVLTVLAAGLIAIGRVLAGDTGVPVV